MTLQEAKNKVCEHHYDSMYKWDELFPEIKLSLFDEVAELYARSKWDEACEAQKELLVYGNIAELSVEEIRKSPNPEFKP